MKKAKEISCLEWIQWEQVKTTHKKFAFMSIFKHQVSNLVFYEIHPL